MAPPDNRLQFVLINNSSTPAYELYRGAGNGFWKQVRSPQPQAYQGTRWFGLAWDHGKQTLYSGSEQQYLLRSTTAANLDESTITWEIAYDFGLDVQPMVLTIGPQGALYVQLRRSTGNSLVRGIRAGDMWKWTILPIFSPFD